MLHLQRGCMQTHTGFSKFDDDHDDDDDDHHHHHDHDHEDEDEADDGDDDGDGVIAMKGQVFFHPIAWEHHWTQDLWVRNGLS